MKKIDRNKARAIAEEKDKLRKMVREGKITRAQLKNKKNKRK
jgi:hypothetical protein